MVVIIGLKTCILCCQCYMKLHEVIWLTEHNTSHTDWIPSEHRKYQWNLYSHITWTCLGEKHLLNVNISVSVFCRQSVKGSRGLPGPPGERGPVGERVSHRGLPLYSLQSVTLLPSESDRVDTNPVWGDLFLRNTKYCTCGQEAFGVEPEQWFTGSTTNTAHSV